MHSDIRPHFAGPLALVAALTLALGSGSALGAPRPKPKPKPTLTEIAIIKPADSASAKLFQ